jgi:hypothetical protein
VNPDVSQTFLRVCHRVWNQSRRRGVNRALNQSLVFHQVSTRTRLQVFHLDGL